MKLKPGQQAAHSAPGSATISLQPRHSGGSTESSSRRPAGAQPFQTGANIVRLGRANAPTKWRSPTRRAAFALHTGGDGLDPLLVFDRAALRQRRERAARDWGDRPSSSARSPAAWSSASTMCAGLSRWPSTSARHGDEFASALGERNTVDCLVRADLGQGFARLARGPAVVADEEFLPFAPELRPGRERDGPALGQRPARHADPDRAAS